MLEEEIVGLVEAAQAGVVAQWQGQVPLLDARVGVHGAQQPLAGTGLDDHALAKGVGDVGLAVGGAGATCRRRVVECARGLDPSGDGDRATSVTTSVNAMPTAA